MQTLKQMGKVSLKLVESTVYVLGEKQAPQCYVLDISGSFSLLVWSVEKWTGERGWL